MKLLEVKAYFVADLLTVKGRCVFLQILVVIAELLEVKFNLAIVLQKFYF